ncbi:MAG: hypothetical protein ACOYIG_14190 [Acetivibrionales bacterium]|jgi:hypothetical protein
MYLIEYKQQRNKLSNRYEHMITIQLLPEEFKLVSHALYFYGQSREERIDNHGEKREDEYVKQIAELERQFDLIEDFENYGLDEILANK